jgi:hypothetical protein
MADFEVFKSFYSEEQALALQTLLQEKGLETKVEKKRNVADKVFTGDGTEAEIYLMIKGADFTRANEIIDESITNNIASIDSDYYLFSFTKEELIDIVNKPDEWNNQDVILARKLLADQGHVVSDSEIQQVKNKRIQELAMPEKELSILLFIGYSLSFIVPTYGIFFGLTKLTARKVLPDGQKVNIYDGSARTHFIAMIVISIVLLVTLVLYGFHVFKLIYF